MNDKVMRVLICGSRKFNDDNIVPGTYTYFLWEYLDAKILKMLQNKINAGFIIEVVEGEAKGADTYAKGFAKRNGFMCTGFAANWKTGRGAGYERNVKMFDYITEVEHNAVIAIWDGKSKGTRHDLFLTDKYHVQTRVFIYPYMKWLTQEELASTVRVIKEDTTFK